jgi:hypothetical protein
LYSYSVLHHPRSPAFDYPLLVALVDLDEGIRLVSNLIEVAASQVRIGMPVEATFAPTAADRAVPVFRPATDAS